MFTKLESYSGAWLLNLCPSPDEQKVNLDITDDDDDERDEENLTVEGCVVESCPVVGCQASQVQLGVVTRPRHGAGVTLEEVVGGALVEIFLWVFQHSEDDGLGGGEDDGQQPGHGHHQPGESVDTIHTFYHYLPYLALLLWLAVFREDNGLLMLMYLVVVGQITT